MSGFDNGTLQSGVTFQVKQFGPVLRGIGSPVPQAGTVGDLYIDTVTWQLFNKRSSDAGGDVDPWGHYIFVVPQPYRANLKWFTASRPGNDIGIFGDYCILWGGYPNYGIQPAFYGPKQPNGWPENGGDGAGQLINAPGVLQVGLLDEGTALPESSSTQLIATGLMDEVAVPTPVSTTPGSPVIPVGLLGGPTPVTVVINPLYTAEDSHAV